MVTDTHTATLKLIEEANGLEIDLSPLRGLWTEAQHLCLTDQTNHFIEFSDGVVVEIVSPGRATHDTVTKRGDYAAAGIPEYWIVNPEDETITVLTLHDDRE